MIMKYQHLKSSNHEPLGQIQPNMTQTFLGTGRLHPILGGDDCKF